MKDKEDKDGLTALDHIGLALGHLNDAEELLHGDLVGSHKKLTAVTVLLDDLQREVDELQELNTEGDE